MHNNIQYIRNSSIFTILFYHGKVSPYRKPINFFELFEDQELARQCFLQPFKLIDARTVPDEEIKKHNLFGITELVQKHIYDLDFLLVVDQLKEIILVNLKQHDSTYLLGYIENALCYIMKTAEISDKIKFKQKIDEISFVQEDRVMSTMAEDFINEGMLKGIPIGMQQGMQQGMQHVALNMLKDGALKTKIAKYTGLSLTDIDQLRAKNIVCIN